MTTGIEGANPQSLTSQVTPVVLVIDTSSSMGEDGKMDNLNRALELFREKVVNDESIRRRVRILAIKCGGSQAEVIGDWVAAADFQVPSLIPNGLTPLGGAMLMAFQAVNEQREWLDRVGTPRTRAIVVPFTDGAPTDDVWDQVESQAQAMISGKHVNIIPVAIFDRRGGGVDIDKLRMIKTRDQLIFQLHEEAHFKQFFDALAELLGAFSRSRPGERVSAPLGTGATPLEITGVA